MFINVNALTDADGEKNFTFSYFVLDLINLMD